MCIVHCTATLSQKNFLCERYVIYTVYIVHLLAGFGFFQRVNRRQQQQDDGTAEAWISCRAAQHSISTRCICVPIHYLCAQGNRICARSAGNISLVSRDGLRRKCRVIHCDFQRTATTRMDQSKKVRETTKLKPFPTVFSLSSLTSFQIREFVNFGRVGYL